MAETYLTVQDNIGRDVAAKTLVDAFGNDVINPETNSAYIVPLDYFLFDSINLAQQYRDQSYITSLEAHEQIRADFSRDGPNDLQRSYNGSVGLGGNGFVSEFEDIASFHYGLTLATAGVSRLITLAAGGLHNLQGAVRNPDQNTEGTLWLNEDIDEDVIFGYEFSGSERWNGASEPRPDNLDTTITEPSVFRQWWNDFINSIVPDARGAELSQNTILTLCWRQR